MESLLETLNGQGSDDNIKTQAQPVHSASDMDVACYIELNPNQRNDSMCAPKETSCTVTTIKRSYRITNLASMHRPDETTAISHQLDHSYAGLLHDEVGEEREEWRLRSSVLLDASDTLAIDSEAHAPLIKEEHSYATTAIAGSKVDAPETGAIGRARRSALTIDDINLIDDIPMVVLERDSLIEILAKRLPKSAKEAKRRIKTERPAKFRRFKCPHCAYAGATKEHLNVHMRKHTGERPYKCNQCFKRFNQSTNLYRHMKLQCNDYSYHCTHCSRGFAECDKAKQLSHEEWCKQRIYQCFICQNFNDAYKKNLIRHMRIHNREQ